ncbi:MAG: adenosylcobinamide-GDP ribazoletransferase [Candidatus Binatia bacterium]
MKHFLVAVHFLTIIRLPGAPRFSPELIGASATHFPIVGLLLGLALVLCNRLLEACVPPAILSVALVLIMTLLTRAFHLDGLADTFDGLGAKGDRQDALKAMRDSSTGVFGMVAVVIVLSLKFKSLELIRELRVPALLLSPVLGRWAMLVLAHNSTSPAEGLGRILIEHMQSRHLILGSLFTSILSLMIMGIFGLWMLLSAFLLTWTMRRHFHRRIGGVTGDTCGAIGEITESLIFMIFALLEWNRP